MRKKTLTQVLQSVEGTDEYIELVTRYEVRSENKNLLQLALSKPNESIGRNAAGLVLRFNGINLIHNVINGNDTAQQHNLITVLSSVGSSASIDLLQNIALVS